jgi:hypothetical protein
LEVDILERDDENFAFTDNEVRGTPASELEESLTQRLARLKTSRQELEKDIRAVERTLDIIH